MLLLLLLDDDALADAVVFAWLVEAVMLAERIKSPLLRLGSMERQ